MIRLSRVELRRFFSRRLVVVAMVLGVLVTGVMLFAVWQQSQPPSAQELADAERFYQEELQRWEDQGDEQMQECLEAQEQEREVTGDPNISFECQEMGPPEREWFFQTVPPLQQQLPGLLTGVTFLLGFLAFVIGATFVAAEFTTGAISNWLTFAPRRLRVYASKLAGAGLGVVPFAVGLLILLVGGTWIILDARGLAEGITAVQRTAIGWKAARILALTVITSVIAAALGFLVRNTAAVLGVAIGYVIVVELMFRSFLTNSQPWLLSTNLEGWINHGATYYIPTCTTGRGGVMCDLTEKTLSFGHSATYILTLTAVLVVLAAFVFRRRDVT